MFQSSNEKNSTILSESAAHKSLFLGTLCFEIVDYVLNTSLFVGKNVVIGFPPILQLPFVFSAVSVTLIFIVKYRVVVICL